MIARAALHLGANLRQARDQGIPPGEGSGSHRKPHSPVQAAEVARHRRGAHGVRSPRRGSPGLHGMQAAVDLVEDLNLLPAVRQ